MIYTIFNSFNLPELFCKTLANLFVKRTIEIKINGICSDPYPPESGIPQRSVLGPLPYLIFINDAPKSKKSLLGTKEDYRPENNTDFVDDNVIMRSGKQDHPSKGDNRDNLVTKDSKQ